MHSIFFIMDFRHMRYRQVSSCSFMAASRVYAVKSHACHGTYPMPNTDNRPVSPDTPALTSGFSAHMHSLNQFLCWPVLEILMHE